MPLKIWFLETRPQFLILSVVLAFLGTSIAWHDGYFHLGFSLLAFVGLLLAHISVNTLNDYFDYKSGVDASFRETRGHITIWRNQQPTFTLLRRSNKCCLEWVSIRFPISAYSLGLPVSMSPPGKRWF